MTNFTNQVLYIGVTNDLIRRMFEHRNELSGGFTEKYKVTKLVYYEILEDSLSAIAREKQIKGGSRKKKIELITKQNPHYEDLYQKIL